MRIFLVAILTISAAQAAEFKVGQTFVYSINGTGADSAAVKTAFVDVFDTNATRIKKLKSAGKTVVCYFSAGSAENWRSDYKKFPREALGQKMDGWEGEKWIDIRHPGVVALMKARIQMAKTKGCDGVDPDNIDGHTNKTGFPLNERNQADYLGALRDEAHLQGLKIGLKNSAETAWKLQPVFDFVVVEECQKYKECDRYKSFPQNGKPMFQIEYTKKSASACTNAKKMGASLIFANLDLTKFSYCP